MVTISPERRGICARISNKIKVKRTRSKVKNNVKYKKANLVSYYHIKQLSLLTLHTIVIIIDTKDIFSQVWGMHA